MKRAVGLTLGLVMAVSLGALPRSVMARSSRIPPPIRLTYRGGPLVRNARVVLLFWGPGWSGTQLPGYFSDFFRALFADGRYMGHLAQYSVKNYVIGNGTFAGAAIDSSQPPSKLSDVQIRTEIRAQVAAGHLPKPDANTIYYVFTPPNVVVYDRYGYNSARDFYSYHDYAPGNDGFPYVSMPYDDSLGDARGMTVNASHELSEVVTDPAPSESQLGWYDDNYGEVADIVDTLYDQGRIEDADYVDELETSDGTAYLVEKFWSNKDNAPVAF